MFVRSLALKGLPVLLFVFAANVDAKSACGDLPKDCDKISGACTIQCAQDGYVVGLPAGWSTIEKADKNLSAHLISPRDGSLEGNCPIATAVNLDPEKALVDLANSVTEGNVGSFWLRVFQTAGLEFFGGRILNQQLVLANVDNKMKAVTGFTDRASALNADGSQIFLVEAILRRNSGGKFLRVWQALYFKLQAKTDASHRYVPARVYFINCTQLDVYELDPSKTKETPNPQNFVQIGKSCSAPGAFCKNLESFDQIFASLTPRECYPINDDGSRMECEPALASVLKPDTAEGTAKPVSESSTNVLIDIAARVAASGAQ